MAEARARRKSWPFYLVLGLILAALPVAYFVLLRDEAPELRPAPVSTVPGVDAGTPEPARPVELRLAEVGGAVQVKRGDGTWAPADKGTVLKPSDAVRTGTSHGSYALLMGGEAYQVKMAPGTEVSVDELTDSISRLLLASGVATAQVHGNARHTFEVKARGSDAVAKTSDGAFAISNNGGTVAVGAREGAVELLGRGKLVVVHAGQESIVYPGQAPTAPASIPTSLLLKVRWPALRQRSKKDRKEVEVAGETEAGAVVVVAGEQVPVSRDGRFSRRILLKKEGTTPVEVRARSVSGLEREDSQEFLLDTRVDAQYGKPDWGH